MSKTYYYQAAELHDYIVTYLKFWNVPETDAACPQMSCSQPICAEWIHTD